MRAMTLADTRAQLSAVVDRVAAGEEVVITRCGKPAARIVAESPAPTYAASALIKGLKAFVMSQRPLKTNAVSIVRELRDKARY